jgi:hypothetical protein
MKGWEVVCVGVLVIVDGGACAAETELGDILVLSGRAAEK